MIVTSDFECGNGKDIRQVAPRRWSITERGDKETYCYYFCVEVRAEKPEEAGPIALEIVGDPALKDPVKGDIGTQGLVGHCPCTIWVARWEEWHPLPMTASSSASTFPATAGCACRTSSRRLTRRRWSS